MILILILILIFSLITSHAKTFTFGGAFKFQMALDRRKEIKRKIHTKLWKGNWLRKCLGRKNQNAWKSRWKIHMVVRTWDILNPQISDQKDCKKKKGNSKKRKRKGLSSPHNPKDIWKLISTTHPLSKSL